MMEEVRIKLSALWIALMLTYLLGDVLRIFSGDFVAGEMDGMQVTQAMYLGMAMLMVIPVLMVILSLTLKYGACRWANIGRNYMGCAAGRGMKGWPVKEPSRAPMMLPPCLRTVEM